MFSSLINLFAIMITAITVENAVFARGLGTNTVITIDTTYKNIAYFGGLSTIITVISCILSWIANFLMESLKLPLYVKSIAFLICICGAYAAISYAVKFKSNRLFEMLREVIALASFNSAVFATVMLTSLYKFTLLQTIFFGIGTGIGFTLATLLVYVGKEQMKFLNIPKAFKGLPITLVYIGIVSLSIYGLIGHQLPS